MNIVKYKEEFGEIVFPEGFADLLRGLPIEEQLNFYRTSSRRKYSMTGFGERSAEDGYRRVEEDEVVQGLIVKDDIVVGVMMKDHWGRVVSCMAEESVCTYYASDNNGAGYKERIDYTWLLCVPAEFDK